MVQWSSNNSLDSDVSNALASGRIERLLQGANEAIALPHWLRLIDLETRHRLGRTLTVYGDTRVCRNCKQVLPYVGLELGNPTVRFVDPDGSIRTMRDGSWIKEGAE